MTSERSTSDRFSHPSSNDPTLDPTQQQQYTGGMMEEEDHPTFVSTSESSKYNMIPDPKFAREYIGTGPQREIPRDAAAGESKQRSTGLQDEPLLGSEKFGVPKESHPPQERK